MKTYKSQILRQHDESVTHVQRPDQRVDEANVNSSVQMATKMEDDDRSCYSIFTMTQDDCNMNISEVPSQNICITLKVEWDI